MHDGEGREMESKIDSWREILNLKAPAPAAPRPASDPRPALRPGEGVTVIDGLRLRYSRVRARSLQLAAPLSDEDCGAQSMPDASPVKWHLAHTTWFFETFVLERFERRFVPFNRAFRMLFNSYYDGVGARFARAERGLLTRPNLGEVRAYRRNVDARVQALLKLHDGGPALRDLIILGLHHEQQHQELILTDVKHMLSRNPLCPPYRKPDLDPLPADAMTTAAAAPTWIECDGGNVQIGHDGDGFGFDNEAPRHIEYLAPYRLASRLVTNAEYRAFVDDGGYRDPRWWLAEGFDWLATNRLSHPIYWQRDVSGGAWHEFTLGGLAPLAPGVAAVHLSYYEADAYARWANARLPTEAEWEHAAAKFRVPRPGLLADSNRVHPRVATDAGLQQMFGDAWQWTRSSYAPYPGFRPAAGAVGEYNGKFMVNQYVLRGSSCATPADHSRPSYRNFFPAHARWQFSSIRLARDIE
jgi:ergothioneine biosynthesis protein EgtB